MIQRTSHSIMHEISQPHLTNDRARLSRQWYAQQPAIWSHLNSLEPNMKCQNSGTKTCDYKKWNSKYQCFMNFYPTVYVLFWMYMFGYAFPLLQAYRKWRIIQKGDQSIWEQQSESGSREHPTAGHILQTAYRVGMLDTAVHSAGSKSNCTVSMFYLTTSVCYVLSAECTTLLQYVWAVCQVRYTNTLCVGSLPSALHWYTKCGQLAECAASMW